MSNYADAFYLSYSGEEGWLGAAFIRADAEADPMSVDSPIGVAHLRGCNPGGEVMLIGFPEEKAAKIPDEYWHTLLSQSDLEALDGIVGASGGLVHGTADEIRERAEETD